ncbi:MAG: Asp23/Gls24 family envelope stress response protein, partial [Chloroflexota bacterium]
MENLGSVRVAPNVLATIACLTTLSVPGVARMSDDLVSGMSRLIGREHPTSGVK